MSYKDKVIRKVRPANTEEMEARDGAYQAEEFLKNDNPDQFAASRERRERAQRDGRQ